MDYAVVRNRVQVEAKRQHHVGRITFVQISGCVSLCPLYVATPDLPLRSKLDGLRKTWVSRVAWAVGPGYSLRCYPSPEVSSVGKSSLCLPLSLA